MALCAPYAAIRCSNPLDVIDCQTGEIQEITVASFFTHFKSQSDREARVWKLKVSRRFLCRIHSSVGLACYERFSDHAS